MYVADVQQMKCDLLQSISSLTLTCWNIQGSMAGMIRYRLEDISSFRLAQSSLTLKIDQRLGIQENAPHK